MPVPMLADVDIARSLDHELSIRILKPKKKIQRLSEIDRMDLHLKGGEDGSIFDILEEKCKVPLSTVRTNEWDRWKWSISSRKVSREKGR